MLYCDIHKNSLIETALSYLPDIIFDAISGKIAITALQSDACCLAHKICKHEEIIILSPWIFSFIPAGSCEIDKEFRYFIFAILHEVAHVFLEHIDSDEISGPEKQKQEDDADSHALEWFNSYVSEHRDAGHTTLSISEVREMQEKYQKNLETILSLD